MMVSNKELLSCKTLQVLSLGCRKHASRFVSSFLKKYGLCTMCEQSLLNDSFSVNVKMFNLLWLGLVLIRPVHASDVPMNPMVIAWSVVKTVTEHCSQATKPPIQHLKMHLPYVYEMFRMKVLTCSLTKQWVLVKNKAMLILVKDGSWLPCLLFIAFPHLVQNWQQQSLNDWPMQCRLNTILSK